MRNVDFYSNYVNPDSAFYELAPRAGVGSAAYIELLCSVIPADWSLDVRPRWLYVYPLSTPIPRPRQGLKIHISCLIDTAMETLRLASNVCFENRVIFKCASDPEQLLRLLGKKSEHTGGKFITVYPISRAQFFSVAEALAEALYGFEGQDILSDRRASEKNAPIFYRYGAFEGYVFLSERGELQRGLETPEGRIIPDTRSAYFELPEWVSDPFEDEFEDEDDAASEGDFLRNGTYEVIDALHYTNSGGVYLSTTADGTPVVIKEARPYIMMDAHGTTAVARLEKEYDTLRRIQHLRIAPQPIEFFEDSHHFLAMTYISEGEPIQALALDTASILSFAENLAASLVALHEVGIVHNDISPSNVLRTPNNGIYLVDFEHAEVTETPEHFKQDIYGFGSVLLWALTGINTFLALKDTAPQFFLENMGCPVNLRALIRRCLGAPNLRPDARSLLKEIQRVRLSTSFPKAPEPDTGSAPTDYSDAVDSIVRFLQSTAEFERRDRLFPADPAIFSTNPISVAYGACGVVLGLKQMEAHGTDAAWHEDVLAWILSHNISVERYPPGLYTGISGIAAALFGFGEARADYAIDLMHENLKHPMLAQLSDGLMYGKSGVGLASLIAHAYTEDAVFLDAAVRIGTELKSIDTGTDFSLGEGTAGIAYFYFYLAIITGEKRWVDVGEKFIRSAVKQALSGAGTQTYLHGNAGVLHTVMRWESEFPSKTEAELIELLHGVLRPSVAPWRGIDAINPSFFYGDSGIGQVYLEAWHCTQDDRYRSMASRLAERVCFGFGCEREDGLAVPGLRLFKLSNDFATGAAGVLPFLANLSCQRFATGFDVLLPPRIRGQTPENT